MIQNVESFIQYFEGIRRRTLTFARAIPPEQINWLPQDEEFTFGDILRHLGAVERITIHAVVHNNWEAYPGHDRSLADGLEEVINYLEVTHTRAIEMLRKLPETDLDQPRTAITGQQIKAWRLLMSMFEHEVHHRSQLASYLMMIGIEPPQIFGLHVDDVETLSKKLADRGS